jgi:predicted RNA-binding Zn ribbon-like protein
MHWTEVDGFQMPHLVGGHPALDFCNTWAGWGEPPNPRREWMPDYDRLVTWAVWAGVIDRATGLRLRERFATDPGASAVVDRAHAFRSALYAHITGPRSTAAAPGVVEPIVAARRAQQFAATRDDAHWELPEHAELPLQAIALVAADLLIDGDLDRIGRCPGDDCGWLFRSSQRRRWCSMTTCGNRAKVRAHAARGHGASSAPSPPAARE